MLLAVTIICLLCLQSANCYINSVSNVDLMTSVNSKIHKTSVFYASRNPLKILIIRRSEIFHLRIHLKSPFYTLDRLQLHFRFETSRGVHNVYIPSKPKSSWGARFTLRANVIDVDIKLPANVPVGFWNLYIYTYRGNLQKFNAYQVRDILILFNPWSPHDSVYYPRLNELIEYVMNEEGYVITGDKSTSDKKYWIYGQFKPTTVIALKIILSKLSLTPAARANPILVSRALSAIVNYHNDNGMMSGKWMEPYDKIIMDGVSYKARSPLSWTGSPEIFEEYIRANGRTLGFAQCWVFASLLTTLGRTLGFASRTITNFDSGHDYDDNATISYKFDRNNEIIKNFSESIWNFHVWTEMYMRRYDLSRDGLKFGGWQILDGTPQRPSLDTPEKFHQLGPTSRRAVKMAEVNLKYDTGFVYAEVNADIIHRNYLNVVTNYFANSVGRLILTRGLDGDVTDITESYKEKEGTLAERISFRRAIALIYNLPLPVATRSEPIKRDIRAMITNLKPQNIGSKLDFNVTVSNVISRARYFNVSIVVYSLYYNGERGKNILKDRYSLNLAAFAENIRRYEINPQDYIYKLVPFSIVRIDVIINTAQRTVFKQMFDLKIKKPALIIKPIGRAVVGKLFYVDVQLINPLQVPLTNCMFSVQGIRLNGDQHHVKPVKPFGNVIYRFALVFDEAIKETVVFLFTSNELDQVQGQIHLKVDYQ